MDLTDPNTNTIHYRKRMNPPTADPENAYSWGLYDPLSDGLLCSVVAQNPASKQKWITLHNPDVKVELSYPKSTFSFKWNFDWESHTFEWKRESCYLLRKPDPPVQVAVTREPAGRIKTSQVQLLDYNLNRFDIDDRKGLEIVMLAALLTFQDFSESLKAAANAGVSPPPSRHNSDGPNPPPVPAKSGAEIISSLQAVNKAQSNDVIIGEEGQVDDYAGHCVDMLKDPSMLYIVLRPHSAEHVGKVIQVAEATKRFHYKSGGHDEELHQYVTMEDAKPEKKGPKIIKLDEGPKKKEKEYKPPQTVIVHLSKIPMPELQPKARPSTKPSPASSSHGPFGKSGGRNPSPSRPPAASSSSSRPPAPTASSSSNSSSHRLSKPPTSPPNSSSPYRYDMALYPPTGPMPAFYENNKQKPAKGDEKKEVRKNEKKHNPNPHPSHPSGPSGPPGPSYQMPGAYPSTPPHASGSGSSGAMNSNRPANPSTSGYPGFTRPPPGPPSWSGPPPSGPPPGPPPPSGSSSLSAAVTNNIAAVGYSLLDKLTHKQGPPGTAKH